MQENVVDSARALNREWSAISGPAAHLGRPAMRAGGVAHDRKSKGAGRAAGLLIFAVVLLIQEERNCIEAGSAHGADLGHGSAQFAGQRECVDVAAASLHQIAHVEQDQRRQPQRKHRSGQHQLTGQVQGIENQQHCIRLGRSGHSAAQHVDGDPGVLAVGIE